MSPKKRIGGVRPSGIFALPVTRVALPNDFVLTGRWREKPIGEIDSIVNRFSRD
jgi:hypothetical protein